MGIEKKDPANFSPSVEIPAKVDSFRFWCQKVLPLVYDDSLSYYELLCKVVNYLNNTIADVNTLGTDVNNLNNAYNELQSYVNDYFSTLDVQNEINNKLDVMAQDGSLSTLIQPLFDTYKTEINNEVNQQNNKIGVLENRMNTFTSLPSGSTSGDAELIDIRVPASGFNNNESYANAGDAVRGQISSLNKDLMNLSRGEGLKNNSVKDVKLDIFEENNNLLNLEYITSGWLYSDGSIQSGTQKTTDYIPVNVGDVIYVGYQFSNGTKYGNQAIFSWCVYDKDYNLIDTYSKTNETSVIIPDNGAYVRLSLNSNYFTANVSIYKNTDTMPDYTDHSMVIKSKYIKIPPKNILYVKKDGICNDVISFYNSITSAINNSVDGDIIVVLAGIYDEVITLGNTNLTIIGTDRDKCILRNTSGAYRNTPLFVSGNVSISNMTIKMDSEATTSRNGYALHIDRDGEGILHFSNCTFYNNVGAALGAGGQNNQYTYFDNCTFISDVRESNGVAETGYDGYGAMFFHAPTSENIVGCGAEFKNCIFKSNLNRVITLSSIQDKSDMYLTFINCNVYSKYNKHNNVVHFNATNHLFIDDMSYGNSTSELN